MIICNSTCKIFKLRLYERKDMVVKNKLDKDGECAKRGEYAEMIFPDVIEKNGGEFIRKANSYEDRIQHWDQLVVLQEMKSHLVDFNGKETTVEIKARKGNRRWSKELQDEIHLIEIAGVTGYTGWAFADADCLAFETENSFLICKKDDMIKLVNKLGKEHVFNPAGEAIRDWKGDYEPYVVYGRPTRKDKFVYITSNDLRTISEELEK